MAKNAKDDQAALFHGGTLTDGWRWFGAHPAERRGKAGWMFRVWAPHARSVSVVGDFNGWDQDANRLSSPAWNLTPLINMPSWAATARYI